MERYDLTTLNCADLTGERPYGSRYAYTDSCLVQSVKALGVLMPVVVTQGTSSKVIAGYRRLEAARISGLSAVPALVLKEPLNDKECFRLALVSNWRETRTELDNAKAFLQAKTLGFSAEETLNEILPLLGLLPERHWLTELEALGSLSPKLLEDLYQERLPMRGASGLARLDADGQKIFSERLAGPLRLTSSQLMKTLEWLLDLMRSSQSSLAGVLEKPELNAVLEEKHADTRQKTDLFFKRLRESRFPRLSACEKDFEAQARAVEKGQTGFKIEAPPYFEEPGIVLRLKVRDPESLDRLLNTLAEKRSSMRELFKIVL